MRKFRSCWDPINTYSAECHGYVKGLLSSSLWFIEVNTGDSWLRYYFLTLNIYLAIVAFYNTVAAYSKQVSIDRPYMHMHLLQFSMVLLFERQPKTSLSNSLLENVGVHKNGIFRGVAFVFSFCAERRFDSAEKQWQWWKSERKHLQRYQSFLWQL